MCLSVEHLASSGSVAATRSAKLFRKTCAPTSEDKISMYERQARNRIRAANTNCGSMSSLGKIQVIDSTIPSFDEVLRESNDMYADFTKTKTYRILPVV
jgi:hypothetical protein